MIYSTTYLATLLVLIITCAFCIGWDAEKESSMNGGMLYLVPRWTLPLWRVGTGIPRPKVPTSISDAGGLYIPYCSSAARHAGEYLQ